MLLNLVDPQAAAIEFNRNRPLTIMKLASRGGRDAVSITQIPV